MVLKTGEPLNYANFLLVCAALAQGKASQGCVRLCGEHGRCTECSLTLCGQGLLYWHWLLPYLALQVPTNSSAWAALNCASLLTRFSFSPWAAEWLGCEHVHGLVCVCTCAHELDWCCASSFGVFAVEERTHGYMMPALMSTSVIMCVCVIAC